MPCCRQVTAYSIPKAGGGSFPFQLVDTMGLEEKKLTEDIVSLALRGHLRSGYKVRRSGKLSEWFPPVTVWFWLFSPVHARHNHLKGPILQPGPARRGPGGRRSLHLSHERRVSAGGQYLDADPGHHAAGQRPE